MRLVQLLLACFTLLFAGFCTFGFLASFEPAPHALAWRVAYVSLGVASLAATACLALAALRGAQRQFDERVRGGAH